MLDAVEDIELEIVGIYPWGKGFELILKKRGGTEYATLQTSIYTDLIFFIEREIQRGTKVESIHIDSGTVDELSVTVVFVFQDEDTLKPQVFTVVCAIMLAKYTNTPIYIKEQVWRIVRTSQGQPLETQSELTEEERKKLLPFRDVVETIKDEDWID